MKTATSFEFIQKGKISAQEYSYFLVHKDRYDFILSRFKEIAQDKKMIILDIGCFPYHIGKALEMMGHVVYGISSEHEPVKKDNISILNIEKDKFPYKDDFFDVVLFNEVIEHLPQSPMIPLDEIYRVTKKEGYLMITTPNIARLINRVKLLFGKSIMYPADIYLEENHHGNNIYHRHNREYTLNELSFLISKTSWNIVQKSYLIGYSPFREKNDSDPKLLWIGKFLNYILMLAIPSLRDTLFVLSKK